jgi:DNA topoisomerase-6 subunit B
MLQDTPEKRVKGFLTKEFSRVSPRLAEQILQAASLTGKTWTASVDGRDVERVYRAIQEAKILAPATDCIVPIGDQQLLAGLRQVVPAEFYTATSRKPTVYRGNPFVIEGAIAYGQPPKDADAGAKTKATPPPGNDDEGAPTARVLRFANRVPLQYQQGACAITKSVTGMNWKSYGLSQSRGSLPAGPLTIVVHMASVWVPFTSESKEAIASYPEILKEIRLVLQDCGRKLGAHVRRAVRTRQELKKRSYIQKYIPAIGEALRDILDLKEAEVDSVCDELKGILERSRKM